MLTGLSVSRKDSTPRDPHAPCGRLRSLRLQVVMKKVMPSTKGSGAALALLAQRQQVGSVGCDTKTRPASHNSQLARLDMACLMQQPCSL